MEDIIIVCKDDGRPMSIVFMELSGFFELSVSEAEAEAMDEKKILNELVNCCKTHYDHLKKWGDSVHIDIPPYISCARK